MHILGGPAIHELPPQLIASGTREQEGLQFGPLHLCIMSLQLYLFLCRIVKNMLPKSLHYMHHLYSIETTS